MASSKKSLPGGLASVPTVSRRKSTPTAQDVSGSVNGPTGPVGATSAGVAKATPVTGQRPARFTYVRDRKNAPVGVVCCLEQMDGTVAVGYSLCAVRRGDEFNKEHGRHAALARASKRQLYVNKKNSSVLRGVLEGISKPNAMDTAMATIVMNGSKLVHVRMVRNTLLNKSVRETIAHTVASYARRYLENRKANEADRRAKAELASSQGRSTAGA